MKTLFYLKEGVVEHGTYELLENNDGTVRINFILEDSCRIEESGDNYFDVLISVRKKLSNEGVELLCNATSVDVYPSAMQLGMGGGDQAYRLKMGCHSQMVDIVNSFDYDECNHKPGTIEEQRIYHERWILSKKKLEVRSPKYSVLSELSNKHLYFWGHRPSKDKVVSKSCLSQWWPCTFYDGDGNSYSSAEQWMMAEKARVFSDLETLNRILETKDPKEAKELGRQVSFFDESIWTHRSYDAVVEGNLLKFGQNPVLKDYLLSTADSVLVEASPYDRIWGIGMKQDDEGIEDIKNWKGGNLLGFALMEVRDILNERESHPA